MRSIKHSMVRLPHNENEWKQSEYSDCDLVDLKKHFDRMMRHINNEIQHYSDQLVIIKYMMDKRGISYED